MSLIIHIGFGKTGTTAIQSLFFENRECLLAQGLYYPEIGLRGHGHHELAGLDSGALRNTQEAAFGSIRGFLDANPHFHVLLSSEFFCFAHRSVTECLGKHFRDGETKIVFYVRQQPSLIESAFLQSQKAGEDYRGTIERYLDAYGDSFDFLRRITPWVEAFGEKSIVARLYDRRTIGSDVRTDFVRLIGVEGDLPMNPLGTENPSLSAECSQLITHFDTFGLSPDVRQRLINELLIRSSATPSAAATSLIDDALRARIVERYTASNIEFASRFLDAEQSAALLECQQS